MYINLDKINSFINDTEKNVIPILQQKAMGKGDLFHIKMMEDALKNNVQDFRMNCITMNFDFLNQYRRKSLGFGGFLTNNLAQVSTFNRMYGLYHGELLQKDIYFTFLFVRPLLERLNYEIKTNGTSYDTYLRYHCSYKIGNTYKLMKSISYDIHSIYGDCYDYGLSEYIKILHDLSVKYGYDLRSADQKIVDNMKDAGSGCLEIIIKIIIAFIIFGGIGMCVKYCSN